MLDLIENKDWNWFSDKKHADFQVKMQFRISRLDNHSRITPPNSFLVLGFEITRIASLYEIEMLDNELETHEEGWIA